MMIETLGHDCSGAWRHLRRSPTFAAVAVFTLAAAIGANTAMFSILNALTLKRVAISEPDVAVNDIRLIQNTTTPGNGDEP